MKISIVVSFLAIGVSAESMARPVHRVDHRALEAQITGTPDMIKVDPNAAEASCLQPLVSLFSAAPTLPQALSSYESANSPTDVCHYTVPDSLTAEAHSYHTAFSEWYHSHSSELSSAIGQCTGLDPSLISLFNRVTSTSACPTAVQTPVTSTTTVNMGESVVSTVTASAAAVTPTTMTSAGSSSSASREGVMVVIMVIVIAFMVAALTQILVASRHWRT